MITLLHSINASKIPPEKQDARDVHREEEVDSDTYIHFDVIENLRERERKMLFHRRTAFSHSSLDETINPPLVDDQRWCRARWNSTVVLH